MRNPRKQRDTTYAPHQQPNISPALTSTFRKIAPVIFDNQSDTSEKATFTTEKAPLLNNTESKALSDFLLLQASAIIRTEPSIPKEEYETKLIQYLRRRFSKNPDWIRPAWHQLNFRNKHELQAVLENKEA